MEVGQAHFYYTTYKTVKLFGIVSDYYKTVTSSAQSSTSNISGSLIHTIHKLYLTM